MKTLIIKTKKNLFIIILCFILFLTTNISISYSEDTEAKNVLVINSYNIGFEWTDHEMKAIIDGFKQNEFRTNVFVEYLDYKRNNSNKDLEIQKTLFKHKYLNKNIDVIIANDDAALEFALDNRSANKKDIPIVFTGIFKESANRIINNESNITGIYESTDIEGTIDIMLKINKNLDTIYIITENCKSGKLVDKNLTEHIKNEYNLNCEVLSDLDYNSIKDKISKINGNCAILLGSSMIITDGEKLIENTQFINTIATLAKVPIYSLYAFSLGKGITGGSLLSGKLQGEAAVELANRIMNGEMASDIPIIDEKSVYDGFDYKYLVKNNISLNNLPEGSIIINKPSSYYEENKLKIWFVIISFIALLLAVIIAIIKLFIVNKIKNDLCEKNSILRNTIKEVEKQKENVEFVAYHDTLTKLPNRLRINMMAHKYIEIAKKENLNVIFTYIDIDDFSFVNSIYGHHIGDEILIELSNSRLECREENSILGRIGGDEFICLKLVDKDFDYKSYIEQISIIFNRTMKIKEHVMTSSASMSYAVYPDDGDSYEDLLLKLNLTMNDLKSNDKGNFSRVNSSITDKIKENLEITNALKYALKYNEFHLVYQPQYNYKQKKIIGYEALIRWENKIFSNIGPNIFIPKLESMNEMIDVGYWIIKEALEFTKKISKLTDDELRISINISVMQLLKDDFVDNVKKIVQEMDVDTKYIEFEVTESVLIESFDFIAKQLSKLNQIGISIALDDFGTGYSSLTHLNKLPLDTIKIDKSFIDEIINIEEEHFLIDTIFDIGKNLNLRIITEGVEKQYQVDYLSKNKNLIIQGYYYSKPLADEVIYEKYKNLDM